MFSSYKILESGGIFGIHGGDFKNKPQNTVFEGAPRDRDGARGLEHGRPVPGGVGRNLPARGHADGTRAPSARGGRKTLADEEKHPTSRVPCGGSSRPGALGAGPIRRNGSGAAASAAADAPVGEGRRQRARSVEGGAARVLL